MNREIKFRGKDIDQNKWRYGSYVKMAEPDGIILHYIEEIDGQIWIVFPKTVGQFTGLYDKNGKEIYEGDIVHIWGGKLYWAYDKTITVEYLINPHTMITLVGNEYMEVLGNIHENPELLEVEQ